MGRHSQPWNIATVLPAIHAGVSGRTSILAWSSKYPATEGAASRAPEKPHTPRVRIGNNHPASRNARAVLCGARPGSNSAKSPNVTSTRSCSRNVFTTPTSAPLTGRVSGQSTKSESRSAVRVLTAPIVPARCHKPPGPSDACPSVPTSPSNPTRCPRPRRRAPESSLSFAVRYLAHPRSRSYVTPPPWTRPSQQTLSVLASEPNGGCRPVNEPDRIERSENVAQSEAPFAGAMRSRGRC